MLDNETKFWCDCHPLRDNLGTSINQLLSFCQRNFVILCQDSGADRAVVGGYSVLACKREYFPLHPSQVPCTCPLLTLSSLSSTLFHSWMLDDVTSHLIGYQSPSLWCDWPVSAPRSCMIQLTDHWCAVSGVWPCVSCVRVLSGVPCTSHPDPVITGGGDKICRASCNMSPANQGPKSGASDQSEAGSASHIAWEAAVITINNNVLIRDPATRSLNNSSDLATATQSPQTLWPHCDCLDKMWRKVQSPGAVSAYLCVCSPSSSSLVISAMTRHWVNTGWQDDRVCGRTPGPVSWLSSSSPSPRYWSGARQVRHGVGE